MSGTQHIISIFAGIPSGNKGVQHVIVQEGESSANVERETPASSLCFAFLFPVICSRRLVRIRYNLMSKRFVPPALFVLENVSLGANVLWPFPFIVIFLHAAATEARSTRIRQGQHRRVGSLPE